MRSGLLLFAIALAGVGQFALAATSTVLAPASSRTVTAHGIRLTVPSNWTRIPVASAGPVTDPKTLVVVGTPGVTATPSDCQIAAYRIPAAGAVVVVVGWTSHRYSGASGAKQGRAPLARLVRVRRPSFECFNGRGAAADVVLAGKAYQVNVMVGDRATIQVIKQALAIGRSFSRVR
jgi:hypothetical protein